MTTTSQVHPNSRLELGPEWPLALSAEERVLLLCARQRLSEREAEALDGLLRQPLDWDQMVLKARWHKLSGLLSHHLHRPEFTMLVPQDVLGQHKADYVKTTAHYLYFSAELARVLKALDAEGIPVIVLKGSALVNTVYREPGLRPMVDMDLLVPNHRIDQAQAIVAALGYTAQDDATVREAHWSQHQHLPLLAGNGSPVAIEIHRHIVRLDSPLAFDIDEFWQRAQPAAFKGASAYVLCPEDLLLHLCLNFLKDRRF